MANRIVSVHAGIYGMGIYAIMLPSIGFSVAHSSKSVSRVFQMFSSVANKILYLKYIYFILAKFKNYTLFILFLVKHRYLKKIEATLS